VKETVEKIPKYVWKKEKSRAYGLPCLLMANHVQAGNDIQTTKDLTSATELAN
jgi:hypothetical protein